MAKRTKRSDKLNEKMWQFLQEENFNKTDAVRKLKKYCKRMDIELNGSEPYRVYRRVLKKFSVIPIYQQNVIQFYSNLSQAEEIVMKRFIEEGDIQDYLAFGEFKLKALGLKNEQNVVQAQVNQQLNVLKTGGENTDEIIQRVQESIGRVAPLIAGLGSVRENGGGQSLPIIPASQQTVDSSGG